MSHKNIISALLTAAGRPADKQARAEARVATRVAWVQERMADLRAAQDRVDVAWDRIFDALPDDLDDEVLEAIPQPREQAELDAIFAELHAVRDHDRWPRHLYWSL